MRFFAFPMALLLCAGPLHAPLRAQALTADEQAKIDKLVTEALVKTKVPSASIAVVRGGQLVLAKAYGKASETIPVATPALPYQIASNSKQFTAMALLILEDEGKLDLDDPVSKYIAGVTGGDTIKLRQLLSHTSGLQDYWPHDYSFPAMAKPVTPQGILDIWARKPLDYAPGTQYQYSNTGYVVAGQVVEKASGMKLFDFLKSRIFSPLGMTSVVDQDDAIGPRFPQPYGRAALGPVRPDTPAARGWLYAAGELSMTPTDLAKWNIARINRTLVPADDWAEQETPVKLADGKDTGYGLGVSIGKRTGHKLVAHTGESVGFLSANYVFPDDKAAVTVMTNSWSGNAYGTIVRGISDIILPAKVDPVAEARSTRIAALYKSLVAGTPDRNLMTPNLSYYFTPQRVTDFHSSLSPLGAPEAITANGAPSLRGGFVIQGYTVKYKDRSLDLSVFAEPGASGRIEQLLVSGE